jgi:hypothetical protein
MREVKSKTFPPFFSLTLWQTSVCDGNELRLSIGKEKKQKVLSFLRRRVGMGTAPAAAAAVSSPLFPFPMEEIFRQSRGGDPVIAF